MDDDADDRSCSSGRARCRRSSTHAGAGTSIQKLEMAMDALRCPPPDTPVNVISGGERRRVALCRLLLQKPDILILDEPTNHLDAESVGWLEQHLKRYEGTVIAVTHDRYFLDNVAGWILELDRGAGDSVEGELLLLAGAEEERGWPMEEKQEVRAAEGARARAGMGSHPPQGRQAKSKARLRHTSSMLAAGRGRRKQEIEIYIPPGPAPGRAW